LAGIGFDDVVVVAGLGPIGMSMLQVCRLKTQRLLIGLSKRDSINEIAKQLGAEGKERTQFAVATI
jgi:threonine dehydrogenase-like Zn-dependent dehydrogenase